MKYLALLLVVIVSVASAQTAEFPLSPEMKTEVQQRLEKEWSKPDHEVLRDLHSQAVDLVRAKGFTNSESTPRLETELFHLDASRADLKFISRQVFNRSCRQIPACAVESTLVEIRGVVMFNRANNKVGYVLPQTVSTSFVRSFYKVNGGGASVGRPDPR